MRPNEVYKNICEKDNIKQLKIKKCSTRLPSAREAVVETIGRADLE